MKLPEAVVETSGDKAHASRAALTAVCRAGDAHISRLAVRTALAGACVRPEASWASRAIGALARQTVAVVLAGCAFNAGLARGTLLTLLPGAAR